MKYVAYYRVSTQRQGASGLGLESQRQIVKAFVKDNELLAEFTEIESGRKINRIELNKALALVKEQDATLVIAKLDRLARNVLFVASLMESKVKFVACDLPEANDLTIHILSAVAHAERKMISERITNALQIAKQKGVKIGNPQMKDPDKAKEHWQQHRSSREYTKPHPDKILAMKALLKDGLSITELTTKSETLLGRKYSRVHIWRLLR